MLTPAELTDALDNALRACAPPCTRFCAAGIRIDDGKLVVHHNGIGNRESDWQVIYSDKVTGLSKDGLTAKLKPWIEGLHQGQRTDLNAAMQADTITVQGTSTFRGPAMTGWPWHWTDGSPA